MHKKKILIDGVALLSPLTGIGRYTYENAQRIKKIDDLELWFDYGRHSQHIIANSSKTNDKSLFIKLKAFITQFPFLKKILRGCLQKGSSYFSQSYDLYWQPNFIPNPYIKSKIIVASIHDLSFLHYASWHPKERIEYFQKNFFKQLVKVDYIITGSHFTKEELVERLKLDPQKIFVIYHGVDTKLYHPYTKQEYLQTLLKFQLPQEYILCVGSIEPRKIF